LIIEVHVKPNCKQQAIEKVSQNNFLVRLKSPPVDGKANEELIKILAKYFAIPKSAIKIKQGQTAKHKLIQIDPN